MKRATEKVQVVSQHRFSDAILCVLKRARLQPLTTLKEPCSALSSCWRSGRCSAVAALIGFPWTYLTNDVSLRYRMCMWAAATGVRIAGVRVHTVGLEKIDPSRNYIFMSNHISTLTADHAAAGSRDEPPSW